MKLHTLTRVDQTVSYKYIMIYIFRNLTISITRQQNYANYKHQFLKEIVFNVIRTLFTYYI